MALALAVLEALILIITQGLVELAIQIVLLALAVPPTALLAVVLKS